MELYASDDSDSEAEISEKNDETSPPSDFIYSIRNHKREEREEIEEAQNKINKFLISRDPEVDSLEVEGESIKIKGKSLNVLFCIPGFRGVNHMPLRFSDEVRRLYRSREFQGKRVKLPYYSEAAQMSRFDFYRDINGAQVHLTETLDDENRTVLDANSHQLEELLLKMRDEDYILVKGLSGKIKLFSNYLHFLQHLYSNGIIKSQRFLREVLSRQLGPQLPNAYNPFVSESETAEHALRYGFGLKSLYQSAALHAHYHLDGKPAFPYLGEIHLSLRGMDVFSSSRERHQIRRLEKMYRVNPTMMIGPEMESTGFGWLPAGEVIYSETIKCPNFKGKWKNKYKEKFGLSKKKFNEFKSNILDSDRKEERMQIEVEIINHLIKHYSNILLKKVVEIAKTRNEILVFLDSDGNISFDLPERDMRNDADAEAKEMREQLEATLEKLCTDSTQEIEVELNSKKMVIYRISPKAFNKAVKDIDDVDHFLMEDEKLRTPLSQVSTPRTSLSSKSRNSSIVFSLSGSAGTPLSHRGFFTSKAVGHDVEEYFDSLTTAQHSNEWYDDESINTLLRHYFPINQHKVKVLDVLPLEGDITHELIRTRLNGEFEKNITTYYLPLRINANHWIGLYIDRTVGNPQIWWIDPYGGISLKRQKEIVTILNQTGLFDIELALNHVHFQPYQLQTDGHNCGPWVIEILRFIRETGGFPDDQSINIVDRRQEHLLITNPGNAHEITDTTSSGTSSTTIYKNITIWTKNSEPTKVESGEIIVEICPEMPTSSTNLASKS